MRSEMTPSTLKLGTLLAALFCATAVEAGHWRDLGEFKVTGCDVCEKCCGKVDGITASGTRVRPGVIATDPTRIPRWSVVKLGTRRSDVTSTRPP